MKVRNWDRYQGDRTTVWIRLYRALLSDEQFMALTPEQRGNLLCLFLIAAESKDGSISDDPAYLAWRLRVKSVDLAPLSHWLRIDSGTVTESFRNDSGTVTDSVRNDSDSPRTDSGREERRGDKRRGEEKRTTASVMEIEAASRYVSAFNAAFRRRTGLLAGIKRRVAARLADGLPAWQIIAAPLLVFAQADTDKYRSEIQADWILRDGKHLNPRTGFGGTDWIERAFVNADKTKLDARLTGYAATLGVLDDLKRFGVGVDEAALKPTNAEEDWTA